MSQSMAISSQPQTLSQPLSQSSVPPSQPYTGSVAAPMSMGSMGSQQGGAPPASQSQSGIALRMATSDQGVIKTMAKAMVCLARTGEEMMVEATDQKVRAIYCSALSSGGCSGAAVGVGRSRSAASTWRRRAS